MKSGTCRPAPGHSEMALMFVSHSHLSKSLNLSAVQLFTRWTGCHRYVSCWKKKPKTHMYFSVLLLSSEVSYGSDARLPAFAPLSSAGLRAGFSCLPSNVQGCWRSALQLIPSQSFWIAGSVGWSSTHIEVFLLRANTSFIPFKVVACWSNRLWKLSFLCIVCE